MESQGAEVLSRTNKLRENEEGESDINDDLEV